MRARPDGDELAVGIEHQEAAGALVAVVPSVLGVLPTITQPL